MNDQCFCHVAPCAIQRVSKSISRSLSRAAPAHAGGIRCAWLSARDAPDQFALRRIAGNDGEMPAQIGFRARFRIQAQLALALRRIRAVARIAAVGENRPDIAVELHASRRHPAQQQ